MCKELMDKFMCVSRKTAKEYSSKSRIEGMLWGVAIGMVSGVAVGVLLNTKKVKQMSGKMLEYFPGNCKDS